MLDLLTSETLASLPTLTLGNVILPDTSSHDSPPAASACPACAAYRPGPQLSGNLQVDPDIHLPSPGMNVDLAFFYNATAINNGPFGYGRSLAPASTIQASPTPSLVTLTRGDGSLPPSPKAGQAPASLRPPP